MQVYKKARKTFYIAATLPFLAGGCASTTVAADAPAVAAVPRVGSFSAAEAGTVFQRGFEAINSRFIDQVSIGDVAFTGLKSGLVGLDPALSVGRSGGQLVIGVNGQPGITLKAPDDGDVVGWSRVAVQAAEAARTVSPVVAKENGEAIYKTVFETALAHIDTYSRYASAQQAKDNRAHRNGFGGIGIRYRPVDTGIEITALSPGSPAEKAGLVVGDVITHVDGETMAGLDQRGITDRLRGPIDSTVAVAVRTVGAVDSRQVSVARILIVPETVALTMDGGIAHLKVSGFNQRTAISLRDAVREARRQGSLKGAILDLRGNPGGLLDQGVAVSDLFLAGGAIVSTRGRHPEASQNYAAGKGDVGEDLPLVVLVDGRSASAAEIVAAALQDNNRAVVVGTTSYGKGSVQTVINLPNEGEMTLTWSRFYTPAGYALHELGILPSICTQNLAADPAGLVEGLRRGAGPAPAVLVAWRTTPVTDKAGRKQLRNACPATRHDDVPLDVEVARRLLGDHALFARALSLLPQVAAQH